MTAGRSTSAANGSHNVVNVIAIDRKRYLTLLQDLQDAVSVDITKIAKLWFRDNDDWEVKWRRDNE